MLLFWLLVDDVHQAIFQSFFVLCQPVLLPGIIEDGRIESVTLHAALEERKTCLVVRLLLKL